jgi:hypothetical protein
VLNLFPLLIRSDNPASVPEIIVKVINLNRQLSGKLIRQGGLASSAAANDYNSFHMVNHTRFFSIHSVAKSTNFCCNNQLAQLKRLGAKDIETI